MNQYQVAALSLGIGGLFGSLLNAVYGDMHSLILSSTLTMFSGLVFVGLTCKNMKGDEG